MPIGEADSIVAGAMLLIVNERRGEVLAEDEDIKLWNAVWVTDAVAKCSKGVRK